MIIKKTSDFLFADIKLFLHPDNSRIINLRQGLEFLGVKIFAYHRLLKRKNIDNFKRKLILKKAKYLSKKISYNEIYDFLEGWIAYSKNADAYNLRRKLLLGVRGIFQNEFSDKDIDRYTKILKRKELLTNCLPNRTNKSLLKQNFILSS